MGNPLGLGRIGSVDCCSCSSCPPCNHTKPETVTWHVDALVDEIATLASVHWWSYLCFSIIGTRGGCTSTDPAIFNPCTGLGTGGACGENDSQLVQDFTNPLTFHLEPDGDTFHSTEVIKLWHGTASNATGCAPNGACGAYVGQSFYVACSKECYHATSDAPLLLSGGSRYRIGFITQSSADPAPTIDDFAFPVLKSAPFTVGPTSFGGSSFTYIVPANPSLYTANTSVTCNPFHITDSWTAAGGVLITPIHATNSIDITET